MPKCYLRLLILLLFMPMLVLACALQQSSIVIAPNGWPSGWLANGSKLLISSLNGTPKVIVLEEASANHSDTENLPTINTTCMKWSSDGSAIAYVQPDPRTSKLDVDHILYRFDIAIHSTSMLLRWSGYIGCPSWSPNNQQIATVVKQQDKYILRVLEVQGSVQRDLLIGDGVRNPAWSPDGQIIAVVANGQIELVNSYSGEIINTSSFPRVGEEPTWSPSGQYIAYIEPDRFRSAQFGNLMVIKRDGTNAVLLAGANDMLNPRDDEFYYSEPSWSPRGDYIAVRRISTTEHDFIDDSKHAVVLLPIATSWK